MANFLDKAGLQYFWEKITSKFVAKEEGKGLSSNDYTTTEKNKLAGIAEGANNYTLPAAAAGSLGGVKVGAGLAVTGDGTLSATGGGTADAVEWENVMHKPETFPPAAHSHAEYLQLAGGTMTGNIDMGSAKKVINLADPTNNGDAVNKKYADEKLATKADKATTLSGYNIGDAYTKNEVDTSLSGKANKATTLSGYGITDGYTKTEIDSKISSVYKPAGSTTFATLPAELTGLAGSVYNMSEAFTTDNRFVEGAGKAYPIGTNIVVTADAKFDVLAGFVDLSGYVLSSDLVPISDEQIDAITAA